MCLCCCSLKAVEIRFSFPHSPLTHFQGALHFSFLPPPEDLRVRCIFAPFISPTKWKGTEIRGGCGRRCRCIRQSQKVMKWVGRMKEKRGGGEWEEWEVGSVKHAHKVFPLQSLWVPARHMEPLSRFKGAFSCRGAANPGIRLGEPLRPTDTQHMCSLARALGERGERNGEERQRSRRVHDEWQWVGR